MGELCHFQKKETSQTAKAALGGKEIKQKKQQSKQRKKKGSGGGVGNQSNPMKLPVANYHIMSRKSVLQDRADGDAWCPPMGLPCVFTS